MTKAVPSIWRQRKWFKNVAGVVLLIISWFTGEAFGAEIGSSHFAKWKDDSTAALSFSWDDSRSDRLTAANILTQYGLRASFNINTARLDTYPALKQGFLEAFQNGHELNSHTVTHPYLTELGPEELRYELEHSKQYVEQMTGVPCIGIIFPYGDHNAEVRSTASDLGYIFGRRRSPELFVNPPDLPVVDGLQWIYSYYRDYSYSNDPDGFGMNDEDWIEVNHGYVEQVLEDGGWGVAVYHNLMPNPETSLSHGGMYVTPTALDGHCQDLVTSPDFANLWIAPMGEVVKYCVEREATTLEVLSVTDEEIVLRPTFAGDLMVFDESLTVLTAISPDWNPSDIVIEQAGEYLDFTCFTMDDSIFVMYDALPNGSDVMISGSEYLIPEPSTLALALFGLVALLAIAVRRNGCPSS